MKIAVIGTFVLDKIYTYKGNKIESLGGISYTISILANLLSEKDEIYPIANVGADSYDKIINFLSKYKNVRIKGINKEDKKNTRVRLIYHNKESRDEILQNRLPPIHPEQLSRIGKVDVILINFITGFELSSAACNKICANNDALKYMDFHSLCLGIDHQGKRYPRKPNDWKRWLIGIDILQLNENEALILNDNDNFSSFGHKIIRQGIEIINITLGARGSLLLSNQNEKIKTEKFPAFKVKKVVDVTGCGDAFAGGFIVDYLKNKNMLRAAQNANRIAGFNSTLSGIEQIHLLAKMRDQ